MEEKMIEGTNDIQDNKLMAILAYLGILVLVPILAAPNSKFARFHANQGVILLIATILYNIGTMVVTGIVDTISLMLGALFTMVFALGNLGIFALVILGIVNAYKGEFKELPYLGQFKILK